MGIITTTVPWKFEPKIFRIVIWLLPTSKVVPVTIVPFKDALVTAEAARVPAVTETG